ncbi:Farnesyl pyrophosphate synthase, partial [Cariama cristata]
QAFFLVADDIMDASLTRRGQLCWYKKEGIGLDAINDAFLLASSVYILTVLFGLSWETVRINPFFPFQTAYQTELGQMLDLITAPVSKVDLNRFSEQRYKAIVKYKTAFYSFYLPVAAAMYMTGFDSKEEHDNAKAILLEMGEFFQIQDDYLDCYGDPELTGKVGTDIQDNKCSWLVVECLRRVTPNQRQILEENYGCKEPEKVIKVKELYDSLGMRAAFQEYEESSYQRLQELIQKHANRLPKEIFLGLARKIYKRQK